MNELKLISQTTPAKVDFNYDAISKQLDITLNQYEGLLFTNETIIDCKKTMAELKKARKSLSDFRIKTKKDLNKSVVEFEAKCKLLDDKFETVINPISEQAEQFEIKRKEDKEIEIQSIINALIVEKGINLKYSVELVILDHMLNKGTTIKVITEDLTKQADNLLLQQNTEKSNIALIKSNVELANSQYNILLLENTYLNMMEYATTDEIVKLIITDAETLKAKREAIELENKIRAERKEAARLIEVERQAKEAELKEVARVKEVERQALVEANRAIEADKQAAIKDEEDKATIVLEEAHKIVVEAKETERLKNIEEAKGSQEVHDFNKVEPIKEIMQFIEYRIFGLKEDIDNVDCFINQSGLSFEVLDKGSL